MILTVAVFQQMSDITEDILCVCILFCPTQFIDMRMKCLARLLPVIVQLFIQFLTRADACENNGDVVIRP